VLATAHVVTGQGQEELRRRNVQALLGSTVLFVVSIWVPEPWRYVLWAVAIASESGAMLREDRRNEHRAARMRRERSFEAIRPTDPAEALDPHHFAERFGLFIIILLGEVVVSAGQTAIDGHVATFDGWAALVAAMIFAAALWWLYFDAAAEINLKVLEMSGGSPVIARAIFATGHMLPAFALLLMAAGVGLLLEPEQPRIAYALVSVGLGIYLLGTRVPRLGRAHRRRGPCADGRGHVRAGSAARAPLAARLPVARGGVGRGLRLLRGRRAAVHAGRAARARSTESRRLGARRMSECLSARTRAP
jgi:low temperature requirement protein LtrA